VRIGYGPIPEWTVFLLVGHWRFSCLLNRRFITKPGWTASAGHGLIQREVGMMSIRRGISTSLLFTLTLFMVFGARIHAAPGDRTGVAAGAASYHVDLLGRWASGPCRDVVVIAGTAYITNGGRLEIVNVSNPTMPGVVGRISLPSMPMGVTIFGIHAYVADGVDGLRVINIGNPSIPVDQSHCDTPGEALNVVADGPRRRECISTGSPPAKGP
jgi:hypothetical protein